MKTPLLLRIAAVITLLFFAGHTSGIPWTPAVGPEQQPVIDAMKGPSFDVLGSMRTYWDFYFGFGVTISYLLLLEAVVLWQLGTLAKSDAARLRPIIAVFFIGFVVNTFLAVEYFFVIPVIMSAIIAILLALAFYSARRDNNYGSL
jgi:hypothetical protein